MTSVLASKRDGCRVVNEICVAVGMFPCVYSAESCFKARQQTARCPYRGQCAEETNHMAAERKREERLQIGDENSGDECDVEGRDKREVQRAESVERKRPTE